jgi:NADPH:quinone reductase-like Zn-dependent oxidoreductase
MNAFPSQMRVVLLEQYQEDVADAIDSLKVTERPVPPLRRGQVLVRIEAAPCNPSDLLLLQGRYGDGCGLGRRMAGGVAQGSRASSSPVGGRTTVMGPGRSSS